MYVKVSTGPEKITNLPTFSRWHAAIIHLTCKAMKQAIATVALKSIGERSKRGIGNKYL